MRRLEKTGHFSYTFCVVDSQKLLEIDTSTREYKLEVLALRQEPEGL